MLKRLFVVSFLILIAMAGQGMAEINHFIGGSATDPNDWNTANNWSLGHVPVSTDSEIGICDRDTIGFPVIAAGESHTIHSFLLGWWCNEVSSLTLESGSTLTCNVFASLAHGGDMAETNVMTINDATLITPAFQVGHNANSELHINGQSSYVHVLYSMDTVWANANAHSQINLAGGLMHVGTMNIGPGTWNIHITNIDAGTRFVIQWRDVAWVQSYIDSGNFTSDVPIYAATNDDGYTEIFEVDMEQARESNINLTTIYDLDCTPVTVTWTPGDSATCRTVYFGTNQNDVENGAAGAIIADCPTQTAASIDLAGLKHDTTYFMRVDESDGTTVTDGNLWSFYIAPYTLVENFDDGSYAVAGNPTMAIAGSTASTDAVVDDSDYAFSDPKALQINVDNTVAPFYTEAVWTFDAPQDWSTGCVKTVSVQVRGPEDWTASDDAGEAIYIRLDDGTDSATVEVADSSLIQRRGWKKMYIALADFVAANADLDLDTIASIAVVVGDGVAPTGTGTISLLGIDNVEVNPCHSGWGTDMNGDCITNLLDFAEFAESWAIGRLFPL